MSPLALFACVCAFAGAGVAVFAAVRARREQRALHVLVPAPLQTPLLVVIPARNEAARLPRTLELLLREPSPLLRVVVVDDASDDDTIAIVAALAEKDARLSLRTAPPHDGSGFGKPRTLHDAITADTAYAVVCCMDADVHLSEGTLGGAIKLLDVRSDVAAVSVMPRLDVESAAEGLLVPAFVAAAGSTAPPSRVHDTDRQDAFLNGQFIVVRRAALDDVGGFAAVSDTVLEDVALARLLKHNGHGLLLCDARDLVATRMYDSFASIVAGFGKNARPLHGSSLLRTGVMLVVVSWLPWLAVIAAALTADSADDAVAAAGIVIALLSQMMNRRTLGSSMWWAFCGPLAMTVVGAVYVKAALSPTQTWRGRRFAVR